MSGYHFYTDLAPYWPLVSSPGEYAEEAAFAAALLRTSEPPAGDGAVDPAARPTLLELGSGGGNNAAHLKHEFAMTLVDLSPQMLAVSAALNPECEHLEGDMRTLRLDRTFDAVFVHDAVEYMTTEDELRSAVATVFAHCRPGGVAVLVPDHIAENYEPGSDHGGTDGDDGRGLRYLAWSHPVRPGATTATTDYAFLVRSADGSVSVAHDTHVLGLFPRETWLRVLAEAGFAARSVAEVTQDDRLPREFFVGSRPLPDARG
ncbi:class I SAM-dependent methyltransferase [Microlunatus capsulatus]|uniref:SAM-dependent methyltransferase n=1 Tax=Microlunatus capsulatus TaxID=99117 RepID=A0ABS4Z7Q8_9ACTN|nr:class I SAM-dependent methyltransferase [Microlunatus capsulatus]MBP2417093.1 SAM-dependent methyltransferase [Microlunatus capsulatus]